MVFITFYRCLLLVMGFGLLHGLVWFPVVLSLIGPTPNFSKASGGGEVEAKKEGEGNASSKTKLEVPPITTHLSLSVEVAMEIVSGDEGIGEDGDGMEKGGP